MITLSLSLSLSLFLFLSLQGKQYQGAMPIHPLALLLGSKQAG